MKWMKNLINRNDMTTLIQQTLTIQLFSLQGNKGYEPTKITWSLNKFLHKRPQWSFPKLKGNSFKIDNL